MRSVRSDEVPAVAGRPRRPPLPVWFFLGLLLIPGGTMPWRWHENEAELARWEFRQAAPWPKPKFSWGKMGRLMTRMERALVDHCGCRPWLVGSFAAYRKNIGASSNPAVLRGRDGWLFFDGGNGRMDRFRGAEPLTEAELASWVAGLEARRAWLAKHGIRFLVVFPPEKASVYAEYVPARFQPAGPTPLAQIEEGLRADTSVEVVDLRATVQVAAWAGPAFRKEDTHWTADAALAACLEVQDVISTGRAAPDSVRADDFARSWKTGAPDLAVKLGGFTWPQETFARLEPKKSLRLEYRQQPGKVPGFPDVYSRTSRAGAPRVYLAADSFFLDVALPFWLEAFSECWLRHHRFAGFDEEEVLAVHPDVVVFEIVEHMLPRTLPAFVPAAEKSVAPSS